MNISKLKLKFLVLFLIVIVKLWADAPIIVGFDSPTGDQEDSIKVTKVEIADAEGLILCTLHVEYSIDKGSTWLTATMVDTVFPPNANPKDTTIIWLSMNDVGVRDVDSVLLRMTPRDNEVGLTYTTTGFNVKNLSLHNFDPSLPRTQITSITFVTGSTVSDTVDGNYQFTTTSSEYCSVFVYYSIDNGVNWLKGSSNLDGTLTSEASGSKGFKWYSKQDLPNYDGNGVRLKVVPQDTTTGRLGIATESVKFRVDNLAPDYFWSGGKTGSDTMLLWFPEAMDTTELQQIGRYSMNFDKDVIATETVSLPSGDIFFAAYINVTLSSGLGYKDTIDTLFDKYGNWTLSEVSSSFFCRYDFILPITSLDPIPTTLTGASTINYLIEDQDLDAVNFEQIEYFHPDSGWKNAAISGTVTGITSGNYDGSFTWNTATSLPGTHLYGVKLRLWPNDTLRGPFALLENLEVDNNNAPSVSLSTSSPSNADTMVIDFSIIDTENDSVSLDVYFSNNQSDWYPATIVGNLSKIVSSGYNGSFKWPWQTDIQFSNVVGCFYLKATPKDEDLGSDEILAIIINSTTTPVIAVYTPSGEQSDTISIPFVISDIDSSSISLSVNYSTDGSSWNPASVTNTLTGITIANYSDTLKWLSKANLDGIDDQSVYFKAVPFDPDLGVKDITNAFHVDNNDIPVAELISMVGLLDGNVEIKCVVSDTEYDLLDLLFQYLPKDSLNWDTLSITGTITNLDSSMYNGDTLSFIWDYYTDVGSYNDTVYLCLAAADNDTGVWDTLAYDNLIPTADIITLVSQTGGDVEVKCQVTDAEFDTLDLIFQYLPKDSLNWDTASITGTITNLDSSMYNGDTLSFIWNYYTDAGSYNDSIYLRLASADNDTDNDTSNWDILGYDNLTPTADIISFSSLPDGNVDIKCLVSDAEFNILDLIFQYLPKDSLNWDTASITGTITNLDSSMYNGDTLSFIWDYYTDVGSYNDTVYLCLAATDNDTGASDTIKYDNLKPVINLLPIQGTVCDTVEFKIVCSDFEYNNLSLKFQYLEEDSANWKTFSVIENSSNLDSSVYKDTLIYHWASKTVLPDYLDSISVSAFAFDKDTSSGATISFYLNQNQPIINIDTIGASQRDLVNIGFSLSNVSKIDSALIEGEYSIDSVNWNPLGDSTKLAPGVNTGAMLWNTRTTLGGVVDKNVRIRLKATTSLTGPYDESNEFTVSNIIISKIDSISTEVRDTVTFPITLNNCSNDSIRLSFKYSLDGQNYKNGTFLESSAFISQDSVYAGNVTWLSSLGADSIDLSNVKVVVNAEDGLEGIPDTITVHLDNNHIPSIYFTAGSDSLAFDTLTVTPFLTSRASDRERDDLYPVVKYSMDNDSNFTNYALPSNIDTLNYAVYGSNPFGFYFEPGFVRYGNAIPVCVISEIFDMDAGGIDTLGLMFKRILGDFNRNAIVDIADIDSLILAWKNKDFSKNLGPISGILPNVTVIQDSVFDLEDLTAFILSWNLSRTYTINKAPLSDIVDSNVFEIDKSLFNITQAETFSKENIVFKKKIKKCFNMILNLPDPKILCGGFHVKISDNLRIDSTEGLSGDFSISELNGKRSEAILYFANMGKKTAPDTTKIYFYISDTTYDPSVEISYHAILSTGMERNGFIKLKDINLEDIEENEDVIETKTNTLNVVPNPAGINSDGKMDFIVNLPEGVAEAEIIIYDPLGNEVYNAELGLNIKKYEWNLTNNSGRKVSIGTYLAILKIALIDGKGLVRRVLIGVCEK